MSELPDSLTALTIDKHDPVQRAIDNKDQEGIPDPGTSEASEAIQERRNKATGDDLADRDSRPIYVNLLDPRQFNPRYDDAVPPPRSWGIWLKPAMGLDRPLAELDILNHPELTWQAWADGDHEVFVCHQEWTMDGRSVLPHRDELRAMFPHGDFHEIAAAWDYDAERWTTATFLDLDNDLAETTGIDAEDLVPFRARTPRKAEAWVKVRAGRLRERVAAREASSRAASARSAMPRFRTAAEGFTASAEPAPAAVERCLPAGGRGLLVAQYKVGKTAMVNNYLAAVADGGLFLGQFRAQQRRVVLLDTELTDDEAEARISALPIRNRHNIARVGIAEDLGKFDPRDKANRTLWVDMLREFGAEVLVLDCLAPILKALGINESQSASEILYALNELKGEAGLSEVLVVHHAGANGKPRGDTGVPAWASAIWTLRKATDRPTATRKFSTTGWSGIDVADGPLAFDTGTGELTYLDAEPAAEAERTARLEAVEAERETKVDAARSVVLGIVTEAAAKGEMPSGNVLETEGRKAPGMTRAAIRAARQSLVDDGTLTEAPDNRGCRYRLTTSPDDLAKPTSPAR